MPSVIELNQTRSRIVHVGSIEREMIAKAAISQTEIVRTTSALETFQTTFDELNDAFAIVVQHEKPTLLRDPLVRDQEPQDKPTAYILMGTDRTLCGSHNVNVLAAALQREQQTGNSGNPSFIAIGSQMVELLESYDILVAARFPSTSPERTMTKQDFAPVYAHLLKRFLDGEYSKILVICYKNSREPISRQVLPIPISSLPIRETVAHPTIEPGNAAMVRWLTTQYFMFNLYKDFLTSALQEFEARLETTSAGQIGARRLEQKLEVRLNVLRRDGITNEGIALDQNTKNS